MHNVVTSTLSLTELATAEEEARLPCYAKIPTCHNCFQNKEKSEFRVSLAKNILVRSPSYSQSADILTEILPWQKTAPLLAKKCLLYSEAHVGPSTSVI